MKLNVLLGQHRLPLAFASGFLAACQTSFLAHVLPWGPFAAGLLAALCLGVGREMRRFLERGGRFAALRVAAWFFLGLAFGLIGLWRIGTEHQATALPERGPALVALSGVALEDGVSRAGATRFELGADCLELAGGVRLTGSWRVAVRLDSREPVYQGNRLRLVARDGPMPAAGDSDGALAFDCHLTERRPPGGLAGIRAAMLAGIRANLQALPEELSGLAEALLLGRLDSLDTELRRVFYQSGCAQLVALSGMHVALAAGGLVMLVRPWAGVIAGRLAGMAGAVCLIWLVGPFPSALRALAMFLLYQAAALAGRRASLLACLLWSGPLVGLADPAVCLSLGFRLSFWALAGILTVQEAWQAILRPGLKPWLSRELATGLSAQFATVPVLAVQGMPVYLQGILAGMVLAPLVLAYLALALLAALAGGLASGAALGPIAWAMRVLLGLMLWAGGGFVA
jgi:competence protein ComEC